MSIVLRDLFPVAKLDYSGLFHCINNGARIHQLRKTSGFLWVYNVLHKSFVVKIVLVVKLRLVVLSKWAPIYGKILLECSLTPTTDRCITKLRPLLLNCLVEFYRLANGVC